MIRTTRKQAPARGAAAAAMWLMFLLPSVSWGMALELPDTVYQGDLIFGRAAPGAALFVDGQGWQVSGAGHFAVGVARDRKKDVAFRATLAGDSAEKAVRVLKYPWKIQRIDGLPDRYVSPPPKAVKRIREDNRRVSSVRNSRGLERPLFLGQGFILPVSGPVTGPFGTQRVLNGHPRSPHSGVDFAAPEGTPVRSPAGGVVRLAADGMYLMGNVLMVDHGLGIRSIFIHLQRLLVEEGDRVEQGQTVALVGKTGRATGPHLHWGVSVGTVAVDPARLLEREF